MKNKANNRKKSAPVELLLYLVGGAVKQGRTCPRRPSHNTAHNMRTTTWLYVVCTWCAAWGCGICDDCDNMVCKIFQKKATNHADYHYLSSSLLALPFSRHLSSI